MFSWKFWQGINQFLACRDKISQEEIDLWHQNESRCLIRLFCFCIQKTYKFGFQIWTCAESCNQFFHVWPLGLFCSNITSSLVSKSVMKIIRHCILDQGKRFIAQTPQIISRFAYVLSADHVYPYICTQPAYNNHFRFTSPESRLLIWKIAPHFWNPKAFDAHIYFIDPAILFFWSIFAISLEGIVMNIF